MRKSGKKLLAVLMTTMLLVPTLAACANNSGTSSTTTVAETNASGETVATDTSGVTKPETIKIMANGTVTTKSNAQDAFIARWEELTGIKLEIQQPDHDAYYDVLGQTFASGIDNWPDVVLLNATYYTGYAAEGALWDMTEAYENSGIRERVTNPALIDGLYLDGSLYGFSPTRGNGCITYIKKAWLDNVGMEAPTNYEEFREMLIAFSTEDPDGNGVAGDTYAISSAGLMGAETPYTHYLPEFYQDAWPSFYQLEDGTWIDGFTQDNMEAALLRLKEAYESGWIDRESLTNGTQDVRNKFYEDKFGVFTYWAGTWATNMKNNLGNNGFDDELIALPPIKEVGTYIERQAPMWSITVGAKNPEGVFEYFIKTMVDGGDMQILWTYGVEDVHWSTKAGTILDNTYAEGEFHGLESLEIPGTQYAKQHLDPMLVIVPFTDGDIGDNAIEASARAAQQTFNDNSRLAPLPKSTDEMSQYNGDLITLKRTVIADVVTQGVSFEDAMATFEAEGGIEWSKMIVDSLNK
jgi:hypothetical protein